MRPCLRRRRRSRSGVGVVFARFGFGPGHFGVGLSAAPGDLAPSGWLAASGVPFDYAYQYLAGGGNTGQGWETWNTAAQFPLLYARDAQARGTIPVFPYYMLLQSSGPCGSCGEAQDRIAIDLAIRGLWQE